MVVFALTVIGFFTILVLAMGLVAITQFLHHRRRMTLIEKGAYDQLNRGFSTSLNLDDDWESHHTLALGLLTTGIGVGLSAEHYLSGTPYQGSLLLLVVGIAVLVYHNKTNDE